MWSGGRAFVFSGFRVHSLDNRQGFQSSNRPPSLECWLWWQSWRWAWTRSSSQGGTTWGWIDWWGRRWAPCFRACLPICPGPSPTSIHNTLLHLSNMKIVGIKRKIWEDIYVTCPTTIGPEGIRSQGRKRISCNVTLSSSDYLKPNTHTYVTIQMLIHKYIMSIRLLKMQTYIRIGQTHPEKCVTLSQ